MNSSSSRALFAIALLAPTLLCGLPTSSSAQQDLASRVSAAETKVRSLEGEVAAAKRNLAEAKRGAAPALAAARQAQARARRAEERVERLATSVRAERERARDQVAEQHAAYQRQRDSLATRRQIAMTLALLAALVLAAGWTGKRFRAWNLSPRLLRSGTITLTLLALASLGYALLAPTPSKPAIKPSLAELADLADVDPLDEPTPALQLAMERLEPLARVAETQNRKRARALRPVKAAKRTLASLEGQLADARDELEDAERALAKAERAAAEEAAFKAEAKSIDYDQLIKNPYEFVGEKVVYRGQIFQIQESFGRSIILLSVTDEGYGFWTDEIWVDAGEISSAEDDIITVYGIVKGGKNYTTTIGGKRFVPRVKAVYIEEG